MKKWDAQEASEEGELLYAAMVAVFSAWAKRHKSVHGLSIHGCVVGILASILWDHHLQLFDPEHALRAICKHFQELYRLQVEDRRGAAIGFEIDGQEIKRLSDEELKRFEDEGSA